MSLILDALKKLERDKQAGEPGVVVVGAVPWQGVRRGRGRALTAFGALAAVTALAIAWWLMRSTTRPAAQAPPSVAAAVPASGKPEPQRSLPAPSFAPQERDTPLSPPMARQLAVPDAASKPPAKRTTAETAAGAPATRADLQLNAISQSDGHAVALIGGRLVHEGDRFDGVRVLRIRETEVEVEVNGQRRLLRF